jgi:hypothetical protein
MKSFLLKTLGSVAALAVWGCAEGGGDDNDGGASTTGAGAAPNTTASSFDSTTTANTGGGTTCAATNAKATATPLDIIFVLDWSGSMQGDSWEGSTSALKDFLEAPESAGISAGMVYFPTIKPDFDDTCNHQLYAVLDVPVAELPGNAFALTNSMPADAIGSPSPLYAGLKGALQAAVARQDLLPKHKVVVVMASDGGYNTCGVGITGISNLATSARQYNGVQTYVIAVQSSANINFDALQTIAISGGTNGLYDASDIDAFGEKMEEIRNDALGCDFNIPEAPGNVQLNYNEVNFIYTPGGMGTPITIPRADDLEDCGDQPGWYYDNNVMPTKILVCPASCETIRNDKEAEVDVAFGCASVPN